MNFRFTLTIDPFTRVSCLEALVIWSNYSKVTNDSGKDISVHGPGNNVSANVNSSSFVHRNDTISKETRRRTKPGLMLNDVISLRKAASTGRESSCQSRNGTNLRPNDIPPLVSSVPGTRKYSRPDVDTIPPLLTWMERECV